jgi:hypothetical protein
VNAFVRGLDRWGYGGRVNDLERRQRRLDRAHFPIRAELVIAFAAVAGGFLWVAAPGSFLATFHKPWLIETLLPLAGVVGFIVGIVWILRLSRSGSEAGERTWRYRDF